MDREAIMTAFCNRVFAAAQFETTGRRVLPWAQVPQQPAIFVRNIGDTYVRKEPLPPKVTMRLEIWIYAKTTDPNDAPASTLNPLIDAVEATLAPDKLTNRQTLGGLVQHCWIEGESDFDPGDLDSQAKAVIPVHILVP